jgi:hypothetical protein
MIEPYSTALRAISRHHAASRTDPPGKGINLQSTDHPANAVPQSVGELTSKHSERNPDLSKCNVEIISGKEMELALGHMGWAAVCTAKCH